MVLICDLEEAFYNLSLVCIRFQNGNCNSAYATACLETLSTESDAKTLSQC